MSELTFQDLIGKTILVGLTYFTKHNEFIERKQYWGTVIEANEKHILIKKQDGEIASLPPDLRSTRLAPKGKYRLHSTGEIVVDPDFTSVWNVNVNRGSEQ